MIQFTPVHSCADKSKSKLWVQFNPDNQVVGFFIYDDEDDATVCIAISLKDTWKLIVELSEGLP